MQSLTSFTANDLGAALNTLKETSGMFSRIDNAFGDITCYDTDGDHVITFKISGSSWTVMPIVTGSITAEGNHQLAGVTFAKGYLCAQGLYLITTMLSSSYYGHLIITKGSNGKCCTIITEEEQTVNIPTQSTLFVTAKGDDTSLLIYTDGIKSPGYFNNYQTNVADRTILEKIPIVGARGSNDYVSGCFTIFMRQFQDPGNILIDGKNYYCRNRFAILDE